MGKVALFLAFAAMLGSSMLMHNAKESSFEADRQQTDYQAEQLARDVARAGYNLGLGRVQRDFEEYKDISDETAAYQGGDYEVDASGEGHRAKIVSRGRYGGKEVAIEGDVRRIFPLNSALYVEGSDADVRYIGDKFEISGNDLPPPSSTELEPRGVVKAVVTRRSAVKTEFVDALKPSQVDNVRGETEQADIYQGERTSDLSELMQESKEKADHVYVGTQKFANGATYGSPSSPSIVYVDGDVKLLGDVSGYGMLLVRGDIDLSSGNFTWEGAVISYGANEDVDVKFTGDAVLYGSLAVLPDGAEDTVDEDADFTIGGSSQLQYSSEAIMRLSSRLATVERGKRVELLSERIR